MEEHTTPPNSIAASAARSAETLRALREQGDSAIESQRERVDEIQQRMEQQLEAIAEAFAAHDSESEKSDTTANVLELQRLQKELAESQDAWQCERDELETQIQKREEEVALRAEELDSRQRELDIQSNQLDEESEQLGTLATKIDTKSADLDAHGINLDERECELKNQEEQVAALQSKSDQRNRDLETCETELAERESKVAEQESANEQLADELAQREEEVSQEKEKLRDEIKQQTEQQARQQSDHQADSDSEVAELRDQIYELSGQRDKLKSSNDALQTKLQTRKSKMKETLTQLEQGFLDKEAAFQKDLAARNAECEKLAKALSTSADHLEVSGESARERDEIQQKFDLALADVQRLREKTATLEQELASRPEPQQSESADLIHLRAERDALADRVSELENQDPEPADDQARQEMADLQRRFELAVEDVRELKTENAELGQKVKRAEANSSSNPGSDEGEMDWESQKRRLMAQLEGDDLDGNGAGAPERKKEIASIQDTVRITDQVVAEKDRELDALRLQLAEKSSHSAPAEEDSALAEAIDTDEVIQQQRGRMAKLEEELQQKLRETELDLSVQRAKIAREQSELAEWRMELESMKGSVDSNAPDTKGKSQAKHRWLSKLGLSGDDE